MRMYSLKLRDKEIVCPNVGEAIDWVQAELMHMDMDEEKEELTIKIKPIEMTKEEFESLPDFTGY